MVDDTPENLKKPHEGGESLVEQHQRNSILKGTVEKVKIKYVLVRTDSGTRWNVPGSHLTLIQSKEAVHA